MPRVFRSGVRVVPSSRNSDKFRQMESPAPRKKNVSLASLRRAFRTIIWPRRRLILLGLLLVGVNRLSGLVLPGSTKYLIDNVIAQHDTAMLRKLLAIVQPDARG